MVMRPPLASTKRRARVAMPDSRCRKLSAVRSPTSSARADCVDLRDDLAARGDGVAVASMRASMRDPGIELAERLERHLEAGQHTVRFDQEHAARLLRRRHRRHRS